MRMNHNNYQFFAILLHFFFFSVPPAETLNHPKESIKSFKYSTTSTSLLNTSLLFPKHPVAAYMLICCSMKLLSCEFCG